MGWLRDVAVKSLEERVSEADSVVLPGAMPYLVEFVKGHPAECPTCYSNNWWLRESGGRAWVCGTCHPKPKGVE